MIGFLIFGLVLSCAQSYHHQAQPTAAASPFGYQVAVNYGSQAQGNRRHYTPPQPTWNAQPQPTWKAQPQPPPTWNTQPQPTWNAQPQQYSAQSSKSLHQRRTNDPNWAVNTPIQPWEAAYNGPDPLPATYSKPQQTWNKPQPTWQQPKKQSRTSYSATNLATHTQRLNDPLWALKGSHGSHAPSNNFGYTYTSGAQQYTPQASWQQNNVAYKPGAHVPASHTARHNDPLWAVKEQGQHFRYKRSTPNVLWAAPNLDTAGINNVHWAAPNTETAGINNVNWAAPNPETAGISNVNWAAPNPATAGISNVNWAAPNPANPARHNDPLWAVKEQGQHFRYKRSTPNVLWAAPNLDTAGINNVHWAASNTESAGINNVNWAAPNPETAGISNVNWAAPNPQSAGISNVNWAAPNPATAGINNVNWAAPNPNTAGTLNVNWAAPAGNNNVLWALG